MPVGQYPLIQYTGGTIAGSGAGFAAFKLGALPPGVTAALVNDTTNNSIDLNITVGTAAPSQNGTWASATGGSWANPANWQSGNIADGIGFTADFSTLSLSANETVTLDGALTIGNLIFGDKANAHSWVLDTGTGGPLTLRGLSATPTITVSNQTATIGVTLAGTQGLVQNGNGIVGFPFSPSHIPVARRTMLAPLSYWEVLIRSTIRLFQPRSSSTAPSNPPRHSAWTRIKNNNFGSTNVVGPGTLQLIGGTNSRTSPDLFFCPDAVANNYYGAALASSTLDLGASQRYIFALTQHNAVAQYDPYEDARIDANIIGAGGITYIAQNTYGGTAPMECQLVLAGSNSFTGEVEIQRGSIYLFTPWALVQTNKLLFDPAQSNNARLFLYGSGATVANLESSGAGNALIANGNLSNPNTIAPATLTVIETSNTVFGGVLMDGQYEYDTTGGIAPGSLSLMKTGQGTLTLGGPNGNTGSTSVVEGELLVSTPQTNGSAFSVADGAALGIIGINTNTVAMSDLALSNSTVEFTFVGKLPDLFPGANNDGNA